MRFKKEFIDCCRRARRISGMTQKEVCEKTGMTPTTVSRFEQGERQSSICAVVYSILFGINMDMDDLEVGDDGED